MTDYDQRLRQVTIGEPDRIDGPIHLAEYDPEWPRAFEREGIDIVLAVLDSADEPHPHERDLYLDEKRRLAARTWDYVQQYADANCEVVEAILSRAKSYSPGGR